MKRPDAGGVRPERERSMNFHGTQNEPRRQPAVSFAQRFIQKNGGWKCPARGRAASTRATRSTASSADRPASMRTADVSMASSGISIRKCRVARKHRTSGSTQLTFGSLHVCAYDTKTVKQCGRTWDCDEPNCVGGETAVCPTCSGEWCAPHSTWWGNRAKREPEIAAKLKRRAEIAAMVGRAA